METESYSFVDIFDFTTRQEDEEIKLNKIVVPIIQRDYAQGRMLPEITRIRNRFLNALFNAVEGDQITLDFIYGDIDSNGTMTPLDGQQRLTTLFLLHWYAVKKENIDSKEYAFLKMFSYETRYSARDFCVNLVDFNPVFIENTHISEQIKNQYWFPMSWTKDQTISSMLVMIDAIHNKFINVENLWQKLKSKKITFYFLPIKDMGLTDELYIKMNSRGKPLTQFEHFKAEFERQLKETDPELQKTISSKIDNEWTTLLWNYRGSDNVIDDEFLRYFRFICDIICYKDGNSPVGRSTDEFDLLDMYFSDSVENIKFLESYFDCWANIDEGNPKSFFDKFGQENIFKDSLDNYADITGSRQTKFSLNKKIVLYATVTFLNNRKNISDKEYFRRMRIIKNLIENSRDEISDSISRVGGNRMPAILKQVDSIMSNGEIDLSLDINFNKNQLDEEKEKIAWLRDNPDKEQILFELEDHKLLYGQIGIVGLENPELFKRFKMLFSCNYDKISCALLSLGDYTQSNSWRRQLGSMMDESWENLFHKSSNSNYDGTKTVLRKLLEEHETFSNEILTKIVDEYIINCESSQLYPWEYYYIKYPSFRPSRYGKYYWRNYANKKYEFSAMFTKDKLSQNAYQPFLKEINEFRLNRDNYGESLVYGDKYVVQCVNDGYVIKSVDTYQVLTKIVVLQNENNIDTEDRILKGRVEIPLMIEKLDDNDTN
jgi:hypothetical protein